MENGRHERRHAVLRVQSGGALSPVAGLSSDRVEDGGNLQVALPQRDDDVLGAPSALVLAALIACARSVSVRSSSGGAQLIMHCWHMARDAWRNCRSLGIGGAQMLS